MSRRNAALLWEWVLHNRDIWLDHLLLAPARPPSINSSANAAPGQVSACSGGVASSLAQHQARANGKPSTMRGVLSIGLMIALGILGAGSALLWPFTVDDTFITLRYAEHLATGLGLRWNAGEPPVEGYTSFVWTLLMAVLHWLGVGGEPSAKWGSWFLGALTLALVGVFAAQLAQAAPRIRGLIGALAALLLACNPASAVHAVSGMDTALFAFLITLLFGAFATAAENPSRRASYAIAGLGLLAGMTRPEGNLVFAAGATAWLVQLNAPFRRRAAGALLVAYVVPGILYFVWRWSTYRLFFPLPFYVKAVGTAEALPGLAEARRFATELMLENPVYGWCVVAGFLALRKRFVPASCAALSLLIASFKPAPLMAYEHRYLYPLLPFLCVIAALGLNASSAWLAAKSKRQNWRDSEFMLAGAAAMGVVALTMALEAEHWRASVAEFVPYGEGLKRAHIALGQRLARMQGVRPAPRIALLDSGAIGYYSKWHVLDTFGLNDPHIALHGRDDPAYVLSKQPDLIVVVSSRADQFAATFGYEQALWEASRVRGYRKLWSYVFAPDYQLWVLQRPDQPAPGS